MGPRLATQEQPLSRACALLALASRGAQAREEAGYRLSSLLQEEEAQGHPQAVLQLQALQVIAARAAGGHVQAREPLAEVATRTCPAGYVRPFLEEREAGVTKADARATHPRVVRLRSLFARDRHTTTSHMARSRHLSPLRTAVLCSPWSYCRAGHLSLQSS